MKPTDEQKREFQAKHNAVLTVLNAAFDDAAQDQENHDSIFAEMRDSPRAFPSGLNLAGWGGLL